MLALNDPNQVIPLPGIGVVILNEQHPTADGRGIVVNGLHLIGTGPLLRGDLIISHAVSGVAPNLPKQKDDCLTPPCKVLRDFTGVPGAKPEIVPTRTPTRPRRTPARLSRTPDRAQRRLLTATCSPTSTTRPGVRHRVDGRGVREGVHDPGTEAVRRRHRRHP